MPRTLSNPPSTASENRPKHKPRKLRQRKPDMSNRAISAYEPITINMVTGINAVTGDTLRALNRRTSRQAQRLARVKRIVARRVSKKQSVKPSSGVVQNVSAPPRCPCRRLMLFR